MNKQMIKPIETVYNGYRFRSRLEARWAVFYDSAGIKYQYEMEGFELSNKMKYLPDFWLPQLKCWAEIKGSWPSEEDQMKIGLLSKESGNAVLLLGQIPRCDWLYGADEDYYGFKIQGFEEDGTLCYDGSAYFFSQCEICGKYGFCFEGRVRQCNCKETDRQYGRKERMDAAYEKARQARFEHGENPE